MCVFLRDCSIYINKMRFFRFKQFQITDNRSAMKVGTDSVILGAWVGVEAVKNVLDIGCGSGLLSLLVAQRIASAKIMGVEIDEGACLDAEFNFSKSKWNERLSVIHADILSVSIKQKYDLIISNPPFFKSSLLPNEKNRAGARHDESLSLNNLLLFVKNHLADEGRFALVFPFDREEELLLLASNNGLFPQRILHTKNKPSAQTKRSFIEFSKFENMQPQMDELEIRNKNSEYSTDYKELTKDFYLNF